MPHATQKHTRLFVALGSTLALLSAPAFAKGPPANPGPSSAPGLNRALLPEPARDVPGPKIKDSKDDDSIGRTVMLGGLRTGPTESVLRLSNLGTQVGRAYVQLNDAATGLEVLTWESVDIPGHGAVQVTLSAILGDTDFPETGLTARVSASFNGTVQHVGWFSDAGVISDLSACRGLEAPRRGLGYVSGPDAGDVLGALLLTNAGTDPRAVTLTLYDAITGEEAGTWTSPDIAGHGALEVAIPILADEALVAPETTAVTMAVEGSAPHIELAYRESFLGAVFTDLSAGCALKGGPEFVDIADEDEMDGDDDGAGGDDGASGDDGSAT